MTPPGLEHIAQRCLAKGPDDRWQSADASGELRCLASSPSPRRPFPSGPGMAASLRSGRSCCRRPPGHLRLPPAARRRAPAGSPVSDRASRRRPLHSRRGRDQHGPLARRASLAFVASSQGRRQIWLRDLDVVSARPLEGTEGGGLPFLVARQPVARLFRRQEVEAARDLRRRPAGDHGRRERRNACWGPDDTILFIDNMGGRGSCGSRQAAARLPV